MGENHLWVFTANILSVLLNSGATVLGYFRTHTVSNIDRVNAHLRSLCLRPSHSFLRMRVNLKASKRAKMIWLKVWNKPFYDGQSLPDKKFLTLNRRLQIRYQICDFFLWLHATGHSRKECEGLEPPIIKTIRLVFSYQCANSKLAYALVSPCAPPWTNKHRQNSPCNVILPLFFKFILEKKLRKRKNAVRFWVVSGRWSVFSSYINEVLLTNLFLKMFTI